MSNGCPDCDDGRPRLPLQIYIPSRGQADTVHADALAKVITAFTLPVDALMQNLIITLTAKHTSGAVQLAFQIHLMVSQIQADTPNAYRVEIATKHNMRNLDPEIDVDVVANGDAGINITALDNSSDAGTINWNFQIWVLDELLLS